MINTIKNRIYPRNELSEEPSTRRIGYEYEEPETPFFLPGTGCSLNIVFFYCEFSELCQIYGFLNILKNPIYNEQPVASTLQMDLVYWMIRKARFEPFHERRPIMWSFAQTEM